MKRHAYLIAAHDNYSCVRAAIKIIDDPRNDIFIHIDADSDNFDGSEFLSIPIFSNLYFIERISVRWGHHSQIKVTLNLLDAAIMKGDYEYYHFLQGADLPIKNQDAIHAFFQNNCGVEFVEIKDHARNFADYKANYFHIFTALKNYRRSRFLRYANHAFAKLQKFFRLKRSDDFHYLGSALFSITDATAKMLVRARSYIFNKYWLTLACDEVFLQTEIKRIQSEKNIVVDNENRNLRFIDWRNGIGNSPKTFKIEDYDFLMGLSDDYMFARKFDEKVDINIIIKIGESLSGNRVQQS